MERDWWKKGGKSETVLRRLLNSNWVFNQSQNKYFLIDKAERKGAEQESSLGWRLQKHGYERDSSTILLRDTTQLTGVRSGSVAPPGSAGGGNCQELGQDRPACAIRCGEWYLRAALVGVEQWALQGETVAFKRRWRAAGVTGDGRSGDCFSN